MMSRHAFAKRILLLVLLPGCALHDVETGPYRIEVALGLDRPVCRIGEVIGARLTVTNRADDPVSLARPTSATVRFLARPAASSSAGEVECLDAPAVSAGPLHLAARASATLVFTLSLADRTPGDFRLFAQYRPEADGEPLQPEPQTSNAVSVHLLSADAAGP